MFINTTFQEGCYTCVQGPIAFAEQYVDIAFLVIHVLIALFVTLCLVCFVPRNDAKRESGSRRVLCLVCFVPRNDAKRLSVFLHRICWALHLCRFASLRGGTTKQSSLSNRAARSNQITWREEDQTAVFVLGGEDHALADDALQLARLKVGDEAHLLAH